MEFLAIAYSIACFVQLAAGLPQLIEIIRKKSSDEMNLVTWGGWLGSQFICLLYIISHKNPVLIAVSSSWVLYYSMMLSAIIYYRRNPGGVITKTVRRSQLRLKDALATDE